MCKLISIYTYIIIFKLPIEAKHIFSNLNDTFTEINVVITLEVIFPCRQVCFRLSARCKYDVSIT